MITAVCPAQQPPTLRRAPSADPIKLGDIGDFRPIHVEWPDVKTNSRDGTHATVTALVEDGKPKQLTVQNGDAEPKAIKMFVAALRKWRFLMPSDGTSLVSFAVTWKAVNGKYIVQQTESDIAAAQ
jgi:hypothetical protein